MDGDSSVTFRGGVSFCGGASFRGVLAVIEDDSFVSFRSGVHVLFRGRCFVSRAGFCFADVLFRGKILFRSRILFRGRISSSFRDGISFRDEISFRYGTSFRDGISFRDSNEICLA